jgi:hypothetical protein
MYYGASVQYCFKFWVWRRLRVAQKSKGSLRDNRELPGHPSKNKTVVIDFRHHLRDTLSGPAASDRVGRCSGSLACG